MRRLMGIPLLVQHLAALQANEELPDNPGFDLFGALDLINVSNETRQQVRGVQRVMEDCLLGENMQILGSELDLLREQGYAVEVINSRELGRAAVLVQTTKGALEA